jgi:Fe-S-cluster containining protein
MLIDPAENPDHLQRVVQRCTALKGSEQLRQRAAHIAAQAPLAARTHLIQQAHIAPSGQRIFWLRKAADLVGKAAAGVSPCSSGCSSCCHINVMVAHPEAVEIGKAIGREPRAVPPANTITTGALLKPKRGALDRQARLQALYFGQPCVFLGSGGECTIYEHRPLACRLHFSLDEDNLLCQPVRDVEVPMLLLDSRLEKAGYLLALGPKQVLADVRDWFPA